MIREIVEVKANDDFTLECEIENGDVYRYDMSFVQERTEAAIKPLADINVFKSVQIKYGALEWPSGYGIHGNTIMRDGVFISSKMTKARQKSDDWTVEQWRKDIIKQLEELPKGEYDTHAFENVAYAVIDINDDGLLSDMHYLICEEIDRTHRNK